MHQRDSTTPESDDAVSTVLGILLVMPMLFIMAVSFMMAASQWQDAMRAEREAAARDRWCSEHPEREWPGEGSCPDDGPRGYDCEPADPYDALKCVPHDQDPDNYTLIRDGDLNATNVVNPR